MRTSTRERILQTATRLFYTHGIHAVGVDLIAEQAGVTKRTLYHHFAGKAALTAAYLEDRDEPMLSDLQGWFAKAGGDAGKKTRSMFVALARTARHPQWNGCGFLRIASELVNEPTHPAAAVAASHKRKLEQWLADAFEINGLRESLALAKQVSLLLDGAQALAHLHRDATYVETAGQAAEILVRAAMPAAARRTG